MFLPWSLITGRPKTDTATRRGSKEAKPIRRARMKVEALEDRLVPANYFVDATFAGTGPVNGSDGSITKPFKTIQDAIGAAALNPGTDSIYVYGNNANPVTQANIASYVWSRDGDGNEDDPLNPNLVGLGFGVFDGNLDVGTDSTNPVNLYFRASILNTATADGAGGAPANLIAKFRDNIVDVRDGSQLRLEGTNANNRVVFTSFFDDSVGGDTNGDGLINAPERANWGGIRYRAEAIDQGVTSATGSFVNFADLRYTGQTVFDEVVGFNSEFASIRMEANATNPANVRGAQVRVWNTIFTHGGRALDINLNAMGRGGKASSVITGPDLGAASSATPQPLTFIDNSINGALVFIANDFLNGSIQQLFVNTTLDDVGVPYVLTQRLVIAGPITTPALGAQITLTFNPGTILKAQNSILDGIDFGEPNDRTYGIIRVNGTANRPVLFTSLSDDGLVTGTDLPALYNNGSADTNNDGTGSVGAPGDWGGIRIAEGNIDHAVVRFGGGFTQINGTFISSPPIRVFARDLTLSGLNVQQVRVSNTEVTRTFTQVDASNPGNTADSPAIDLFSRDDGDTRFGGPTAPVIRTGDVQIIDNNIHDNQGKAIQVHPLYFQDARNTQGGYGVLFRRNTIENNAVNGAFVQFTLDRNRGIDQNLASAGAVMDDTDIVTVIDGEALVIHPDQYFAMMSRRTVTPDPSSGGYLQRFTSNATSNAATTAASFIANLVLRLPGNLPTTTTLPMNLPLQRGPISVNPGLVDSGLFYYQTDFATNSRNVNSANQLQRGEEWRDWGVNFVYNGLNTNINDPLRPFRTVADPINPGGQMLQVDANDGNGTYEMVFPNAVSAVGFFVVNNQSTSPTQRIELIGIDGKLIESAALPPTTANGRAYFGRISKTPIYKVRIIDDAGDAIASQSTFGGAFNVTVPGNNTNASAVVNVPSSFNINDVRVSLSVTQAKASDLILELVGPGGQVVQLANRTGGTATGANYTGTNFSNSYSTPITAGVPSFSGTYYPVSFDPFDASKMGLAAFNGTNAQGNWTLRVRNGAASGQAGTITNFTVTFKGAGLTLNNPGITGLTWVDAGESLVVKANSPTTTITAGSIARGYAGVTQNVEGLITDGFLPQMTHLTNGTNAAGQFTFGQNTTTTFTMGTPTALNNAAGDNIIQLPITSNFVATDLTVRLNLTYSGANSDLRVRLRAPDGSEIELVGANQSNGNNGFTNTVFDDQAQMGLKTVNINTGAQFTAPYTGTFQSWSFTNTVATAPTTITPFGLGFYRGKNVNGTWAIVVSKNTVNSGTLNNFTLSFRAPTSGWGSTLRILGTGANPVVLTGIDDDTIGSGTVGKIQRDTRNDGPSTANPGQWNGVRILAGVNTSMSEVVTQNANGTLNRRYADFNPYTRGDEGLTYPGLTNTAGLPLSYQDQIFNSLAGTSGGTSAANRAPFDSVSAYNLQDGTLLEYADIRFATTGVDVRGYPKTKLAIDGNEYEMQANPNGSVPGGNEIVQPLPVLQINQLDQVRFATTDGTYTVAGRLGGTGDGPATDDVDWYELPNNTPEARTISLYIDVERGRRSAGNDEPNFRPTSVAVFNVDMQLLWWSGAAFGGYADGTGLSGNTLGPITLRDGDIPYNEDTGFARDAKFIAVMPNDRVPRSFIPTTANPAGLQPDMTTWQMGPFQADRVSVTGAGAGADGGAVTLFDQMGVPQTLTGDAIWDPSGPSGTTIGGYEMQLRFTGFERQNNPPKPAEGQILVRSNTIINSSGDAIVSSDLRMNTTNTSLGATMPLQAARYPFTATNLAVNNTGNPFRNEDVNNLNPSFSAPANFVPGITIQNNLIVSNQGAGIVVTEDRNTNAISAGNYLTPTAFTQISNNTIDNNTLAGIALITRGGPTVQNNIVSNNGFGIAIVDGYDINNLTPAVVPAVSYNIFYRNTNGNSGTFTGTNNIIGTTPTSDPLYVDPSSLDYRLRLASPGVDSGISDLQDRLRSLRFPQLPTRAPNLDLRGRSRVDNPNKNNTGVGSFPFYDRGALEANELSLRVIGLSVLADNNILGTPVSSLVITFAGRVDLASFNANSVTLRTGATFTIPVGLNFNLRSDSYDKNSDTHTFVLPLTTPITDGTYLFSMNGSTTGTTVQDVAGQRLDGEFPAPYNLPSGDGSAGGTFNYQFTIRTGTISGTVWNNANGNTSIDSGEAGLGSVQVRLIGAGPDGTLFTTDDVQVATATTTTAGAYTFNNLASGQYYVTVNALSLPANFRLNTPPANKPVSLNIGGVRSGLNFGYWLDTGNNVVSGRAYNDLNNNQQYTNGEPAVTDNGGNPVIFTVTLTSGGTDFDISTAADNVVYTTTTGADGSYSFTGTGINPIYANNFVLSIDNSPLPSTYVQVEPSINPVTFSLLPGGTRNQNFGYQENQATITGLVFNDVDGSGTLNGGELGIAGVSVQLLGAGLDGIFGNGDDLTPQSTVTNASGNFTFFPLRAGVYRTIVNGASAPLANSYLTTGNAVQTHTLNVGNGIFTAANVGYRTDPKTGQIAGIFFNDANGDGQYQLGEAGFNNINVNIRWAGRNGILNDSDDQLYTATTTSSGAYGVNGLPVGDFYVSPVAGQFNGFALTGPATDPQKITLGFNGTDTTTGLFGYLAANSSITGFVFNDLDGNGSASGVETGRFPGVRVFIDSNSNGQLDLGERSTVASNVTGIYTLSNLPANLAGYEVLIDSSTYPPTVPAGFKPSTGTVVVPVGTSVNVTGINLGLQQRNSRIQGTVWIDADKDGIFDTNEVGSPNQTVTITFTGTPAPANFPLVQTLTTGADGKFDTGFELPAGQYRVETTVPTGGLVPPTPGNPQIFTLAAGTSTSRLYPVQFAGQQSAGVWYFTFSGTSTVLTNSDGSTLTVNDTDIIRLTAPSATEWHYDYFFRGQSFGLSANTNEGIDAFTFTNTGDVVISTKGAYSISTNYSFGTGSGTALSGFGEDLIRFTPGIGSVGGGIDSGTWSKFFVGARVGLSGPNENVDAVSLVYSGTTLTNILLSTTGSTTAGTITANPADVFNFRPSSAAALGANTAGTFSRFFLGASSSLSTTTENVDALFYQANGTRPSLFMSSSGNYSVPSNSGDGSDIFRFDATVGGPVGQLAGSITAKALAGSTFGHGGKNVTGFWMGSTPSDPNPFLNSGFSFGNGGNAGIANSLVALGSSTNSVTPVVSSAKAVNSTLAATVVTSNAGSTKAASQSADVAFTTSKRDRASASTLAKSLLSLFGK